VSDIERKLASVRMIAGLRPIPGADAIECAMIDGWEVVVKKGEFIVGQKCVYFEIDSFLPVREDYEFLRKSSFKSTKHLGDGFRLRTIKLRGQISQGLALPCDESESFGADLTERLGVKKWELPDAGGGLVVRSGSKARASFPRFLRRTDQERIQNCFGAIKSMPPDTWFEATLKLDGSSMTVWHKDGQSGVCSRNLNLIERERAPWLECVRRAGEFFGFGAATLDRFEDRLDAIKCRLFGGRPGLAKQQSVFWDVARNRGLIDFVQRVGQNVALQGELMGPGVQGNREGLPDHRFYLFDIWDIDAGRYLSPNERSIFLGVHDPDGTIESVPFLGMVALHSFRSVGDFLAMADRRSLNHPVAEGVVFKGNNGQTSFKAINNAYLLKEAA